MIQLDKLIIKHFGSFKSKIVIEFPKTGLFLLQGENGSGKSSILKAIAYCLDFLSEPATEFINWEDQQNPEVELYLKVNNEEMILSRGSGFYTLKYQNVDASGSTDVKKKLKELLLDPYFISIMTNREQGEGGNFSALGPSEKQEFLSQLLSLGDFDVLIDKTENEIKKLESDLIQIESQKTNISNIASLLAESIIKDEAFLINLEMQQKSKQSNIDNYPILDLTQLDTEIQNLYSLSKLNQGGEEASEKYLKDFDDNILKLNKQLSFLNDQSAKLDNSIKDYNNQINKHKNTIIQLNGNIKLKEKYQNDIDKLKKNKCPTCEQEWLQNLNILSKYETALIEIAKNEEDRKKLLINISLIEEIILRTEKERDYNKEQFNSINKLLLEEKFAKNKLVSDSILNRTQLTNLQREKQLLQKNHELKLENLKTEISQIKDNCDQHISNINMNYNKLEEFNNKLKNLDLNKLIIQSNINKENEVLNASKNFVRLISDETLKMISKEVSDFLQFLPNANKFYIKFDTSKILKSGKVKKEITLKVFKNGSEVSYRRLSGGERCSVNLAIDLAVAKVLSLRTGKHFSWFSFDEALDGLSVVNKTEALGLLKNIASKMLILIIEHSGELSHLYDEVIKVENKVGGSRILRNL